MRILALSAFLVICWLGAFSQAQHSNEPVSFADNYAHTAANPVFSAGDQGIRDRDFMQLYTVAHIDALAMCNDGSPGAYYHRPGTADNSTSWVIRFLGGAWCWDGPSCTARNATTPFLMSTSLLPPVTSADMRSPGRQASMCIVPNVFLQTHGITSTDPAQNPSFHGWNHVHVWYCSSDSHLGDISTGATSDFGGLHFRGKRIAAAVVADLLAARGLANATEVLLTGDSAGGVGVMNNADWVGGLLRAQAPDLTNIRLFVDGGWFLDIVPFANRSDGMTFKGCAHAIAESYNATFDRSCELAQAPGQAWRCFFAAVTWRHLATPVLFHEYLYDSANLGYDGAAPAQYGDFRRELEASFVAPDEDATYDCCDATNSSRGSGSGTLKGFAADAHGEGSSAAGARGLGGNGQGDASRLQGAPVQAPRVLQGNVAAAGPLVANGTSPDKRGQRPNMFSPACHLHEMIDGVQFTTSHVGAQKLTDVLAAWFGGATNEVFLLDSYEGVRRSDECGVDPAAAAGELSAVVSYSTP